MRIRQRRSSGFTLTEILVAVAVFSIVMGAIAGVYIAGVRTVRRGEQVIASNEESRLVFNTLERDLTTAFTSRAYGDYYQFYGTPVGMTFVGLTRSYESRSTTPNLARITYALMKDEGLGYFDTTVYDEDTDSFVEGIAFTCPLLRYVEPNAEDLDAFPIDWEKTEYGFTSSGGALKVIEDLDWENGGQWDSNVVEELLRAKKRQLWIRMIGQSRGEPDGFPSAWNVLRQDQTDPTSPLLEPLDYVVSNDFVVAEWGEDEYAAVLGKSQAEVDALSREDLIQELQEALRQQMRLAENDKDYEGPVFFRYGLTAASSTTWQSFWNADYNLPFSSAFNAVDTDQNPRMPLFAWPSDDAYDDIWEEMRDTAGLTLPMVPAQVIKNELNRMQDLVADASRPLWLIDEIGTPFKPRLPEVVQVTARIKYERPYPGAPDHERKLAFLINVPCGVMRSGYDRQ